MTYAVHHVHAPKCGHGNTYYEIRSAHVNRPANLRFSQYIYKGIYHELLPFIKINVRYSAFFLGLLCNPILVTTKCIPLLT